MSETFERTRSELEAYFDGTANEAWKRMMSDAPVSRIRATVRAGRDRMRAELLGALPPDLRGARVLDAGCGNGQLAVELAGRGASVIGVDISPKLLEVARRQIPQDLRGLIDYRAGDMLDPGPETFDFVVAMDSLIHYRTPDIVSALARLSARSAQAVLFTVAPATPLLSAMHLAGKLFPRADRSPAIVPAAQRRLRAGVAARPELDGWHLARRLRVNSGFYISQAMELRRS